MPRLRAQRATIEETLVSALNIETNLARPDDFYESLIDTHRDLTREESELVNCKLILLLANHVGDLDVLREAMARARDGVAENHPHSDPPLEGEGKNAGVRT